MSRATITIDDLEGGAIDITCCYEGGFGDSPAHVAAACLLKHMDTLGQPDGDRRMFAAPQESREAILETRPEDSIPSGVVLDVRSEDTQPDSTITGSTDDDQEDHRPA